MTCRIRSHTVDAEENSSKENFNSTVIIEKPIYEEEDESQEDDVSTMIACKRKVRFNRVLRELFP